MDNVSSSDPDGNRDCIENQF